MTLIRNLLGTNPVSGAVDPEAVSFDGSNDYLSRSSSLTADTGSKAYTVSFFGYPSQQGDYNVFIGHDCCTSSGNGLYISFSSTEHIVIRGYSGGKKLNLSMNNCCSQDTWNHVLVSWDSNGGNTSNVKCYVNDVAITPNVSIFNDQALYLSGQKTPHIGHTPSAGFGTMKGRLAHLFIDQTYRDLSITANRRLFTDSDGKPADGQASLNPILYLPMTDASSAGTNEGTGGDFTVNGVLDTASRAPNQDNCSASKFDGVNDNLYRTIGGSFRYVLVSFNFIIDQLSGNSIIFDNDNRISLNIYAGSGGYIEANFRNSSGSTVTSIGGSPNGVGNIIVGKHYSCQIAFDTQSSNTPQIYMNGVNAYSSGSVNPINGNVSLTTSSYGRVGTDWNANSSNYFKGQIGELYIGDFGSVPDLATDNPFWDADANRPKSVRQVISETGTTPLIALPLRGDDAGNNLGTGGDFTVNSGPYTGARGGSEFWARSMYKPSTNIMYNNVTQSNSFTFTFAFSILANTASQSCTIFEYGGTGWSLRVTLVSGVLYFFGRLNNIDTMNSQYVDHSVSDGNWRTYLVSLDLQGPTPQQHHVYRNNIQLSNNGVSNSFGGQITGADVGKLGPLTKFTIGNGISGSGASTQTIGFLYFHTGFTDFSQESMRHHFMDQLGFPKDLTPAIENGDITNPLIYMKFDDPSDLTKNSGTGGDFTQTGGAITSGADVDPTSQTNTYPG